MASRQDSRHSRLTAWSLPLRMVVALAIAMLTLPVLNGSASADELTPASDTTLADSGTGSAGVDVPGDTAATPDAGTDPVSPDGGAATEPPATQPGDAGGTAAAGTDASGSRSGTTDGELATPQKIAAGTTLSTNSTAVAPLVADVCDQGGSITSFMQNTDKDMTGDWENGNMNAVKANLVEGGFVWQRVIMSNLNEGPQELVLTYDVTSSDKYAYDYLDDFSLSTGGEPTVVITNGDGPVATATITWDQPSGATSQTLIFGAHIASELDWGPGTGAGSISGSPYHVSLETLNCAETGQKDNQIMAAAIDSGLLTVVKDAVPNASDDFDFTIEPGGDASSFSLDDDADPILSNTVTYRVPPNTYTVTETETNGWALTDITCTPVAGTRSGDGVSVAIADDADVTCVFTNSRESSLTVDKVWDVNGTSYQNGQQPAVVGASAQLTLDGVDEAWGTAHGGYLQGDQVDIDETTTITNDLCTLTGSSVTSEDPDAALPFTATLDGGTNSYTVTNTVHCDANLTLVKTVSNGDASADDWTLTAAGGAGSLTGPSGTSGVSGAVSPGASYDLSESDGPLEYVRDGAWACTNGATVSDGASVAVPMGVSSTCTVTNATARLILQKDVDNDHGGTAAPSAFVLTATPQSGPPGLPTLNVAGNSDGVGSWVRPGVTYDLSESAVGGYALESLRCDTGAAGAFVDATSVSLDAGDTVTCRFTNQDQAASLTLVKVVDNGTTGASSTADEFTLTATGPTSVSGNGDPTSDGGVSDVPVSAGDYTLSESGPAGYDPSSQGWSCVGANQTGNQVHIDLGDDVTCTITNLAVAPKLTLVKQVRNGDTGATAVATDWMLHADGPVTDIDGTTGSDEVTSVVLPIGSYTLSETGGPSGYAASDWDCGPKPVTSGDTIALGLRDDVTCTITNTAISPILTLVKHVENGDTGGTAAATDWTLHAVNGSVDEIHGDGGATGDVVVGTYALSETGGPDGYTASAWSCDSGKDASSGTVTLAAGDDVTCEITNTAVKPSLTLVKHVLNGSTGGSAVPSDWTLHAVNGVVDEIHGDGGASGDVVAGTYALSETGGPDGYVPSTWTCDNGQSGSSVTVGVGDAVTCEISNVAAAPQLTLVKHVDNGTSGGNAVAADWLLSATRDATTEIHGDGTASGPVPVGTYALAESGPAGYEASGWTCDNGESGASVSVALGDDVTCEITNTAIKPHLKLVKSVDNTGTQGTAEPADWTLSAVNGSVDSLTGVGGAESDVRVGTYVLGEALTDPDGPVGYTAGHWACVDDEGTAVPVGSDGAGAQSVDLALADDLTCTITNTAQPEAWTVAKSSTTDPDPLLPDGTIHYTLSATHTSGVVPRDVVVHDDLSALLEHGDLTTDLPDEATVSTEGLLTWTIASLPTDAELSFDIVLDHGAWGLDLPNAVTSPGSSNCPTLEATEQHPECTTLDHTPALPTLTLVKDVQKGETGDDAVPSDWTLTATPQDGSEQQLVSGNGDPSSAAGVNAVEVLPGSYDLAEEGGPDGYQAKGWSCAGGTFEGSTVQLAPDEDVTCTVVNEAIPGTFEVEKTSDPEDGTAVEPGDTVTYTITATHLEGVAPRDVQITDDLSDVLDDATLLGGLPDGVHLDGSTLTWTIAKLETTASISYSVRVNGDAVGTTLRNVVVAPASVNCPELTEGAVVADECTTEHPIPAWTLEKTSDPVSGTEVDPGQKVTYTLTAVNTSDTDLVNATVVDDLSDVLDDASLDAVPAGASLQGDELTWEVPDLAPGESATLSYTVTVNPDASAVALANVAVPLQATGSCVAADRCETTHPVPEIGGTDIVRPRPPVVAPPALAPAEVLPATGAPEGAGWLMTAGGLAVVLGAWLVLRSRRRGLHVR